MKKHCKAILWVLFLIILCFSCKKEILYEGPVGDVKGRLKLYDSFNAITDYSGVEVSIDGTSPIMKTTTGKDGVFTFTNLKTGVYNLIFKKQGYVTHKILSWEFVGGNIPVIVGPLYIYKLPDSKVTDLKVDTSYIGIVASAKVSNYNQSCYRYFIGDEPDVSCEKFLVSNTYFLYGQDFKINLTDLTFQKFAKGKKLYIILYPSALGSGYLNIETGTNSYPVNPEQGSKVVGFTVPYNTYLP